MEKIIFLNTAWMERYEGLSESDHKMTGGGAFVDEKGYGHDMFNFKNINGKVYGYVQPVGRNNLQRLGASKNAECIEGVLAIFTAKYKEGGTYIVGWYWDAKFYRDCQDSELDERNYKGEIFGYYVCADAKNATLLNIDERASFPRIPKGVGGMGRSNVWYADKDIPKIIEFKKEVLKQIKSYEKKNGNQKKLRHSSQVNTELKKQVEQRAVEKVKEEYSLRGFIVKSVEHENLGWDLEALREGIELKIEVKGLSGNILSVDLTPNEYKNMKKYKDSYRLCVVTECLNGAVLYVFFYSSERNEWISEDGHILQRVEIVSVKCSI